MSTKKRINALEKFGTAVNGYFRNGKLTPGYAVAQIEGNIPDRVLFVKYSKMSGLYFACTPDHIETSTDGKNFTYSTNCDGTLPFLVEDYQDGVGCSTVVVGRAVTSYTDTKVLKGKLGFSLDCGVMHCGRLFGGDGCTLRWSGAESVMDWDRGLHSSGYLKLDPEQGNILNLIVYGGKLVAVREYGLTVFSMHGAPENFSVRFTNTDCDDIYRNTACTVGGKLYFFSLSGLKSFDGTKISPIKLRHAVTNPGCSVEYGGKYFIACRSVALGRNVILCVDSDLESCIIDISADVLYVKDGVRLINSRGQYILIDGGSLNFKSSVIDFGTDRPKTVTEVKVAGKAFISVSSDSRIRAFQVNNGTVYPHMRGRHFTVTVQSQGEVSEVLITAEVMDAV